MGAPVGVNCESFWRFNLNLIMEGVWW